MPYSGQFSVSGGPTFSFLTPDGVNVTVAAYVLGQLAGGAATLSPSGTTSAVLGGGGGPGSSQASASISTTSGTNPMTTLTWTVTWFGQQGSGATSGTLASWPTP
jgi:hypothetical protein